MKAATIWADVQAIREAAPLVHNITNYVVMNTTANALLALGASPVMAHAIEEVEEMVGLAGQVGGALVVNIGTLSHHWIASMRAAMQAARQKGLPIVFDPVGAGATRLRTETCKSLLADTHPTVIRGNASEIMALLDATVTTKGVDSAADANDATESAKALAKQYQCIASVSGKVDIVTDGDMVIQVRNGHAMMTKVTGLGCTASALTGAFVSVNSHALEAAANAMATMGICGEIAAGKASGPGTLQLHLYDALYNVTQEQIEQYLN